MLIAFQAHSHPVKILYEEAEVERHKKRKKT
jgi:hypothetical protein